ncbi:energy-coupling factor ABC transporter ATP-binding protein [Tessaracoccus defluvii]|uniref:ABC transporter ATP-binding protein n=1 Tax=Tessaracoccus defluvii TaxID=1285901 RepID=A0A7H0H7C8_9ACTN|nr:ABC transporter ATP-binding protein [Tessaracoccus defluvii]QNP56444.1 ABC transporter ATP-binding protein [Tessaracoccus defluvii]
MISVQEASVVVPAHRRGEADRVLLDRISLELTEHRIAVIGANGSGKSTLLRLFNGLRAPTSGRVSVAGKDTVKDAAAVRARVGFVFTDPLAQLLMSTPVEDVALSLRAKVKDRAERARRAQELLDLRGVGHTAHQSIYDLSGGERQLVALTSVLAVEPRIVVADEPTTLLDLRNRGQLREVLAGLPQQVIVSTHDLDFAADAERVIVVDAGRVIADGEPREAIAAYVAAMAR